MNLENSRSNLNSCTNNEEQVEAVAIREEIPVVDSNAKGEFSGNESIWAQVVEIVKFSGPAVGLWLCGPLMSLIDTAVIGQGSSIELAALGRVFPFLDVQNVCHNCAFIHFHIKWDGLSIMLFKCSVI